MATHPTEVLSQTATLYPLDDHRVEDSLILDPLLTRYPNLLQARARLLDHPVYQRVNTIDRLRRFMEDHVFAVWDFMSLTKRLQRELTCVSLPWQTPHDAVMARFINEIVLGEESDEGIDGVAMSHLELYLAGMQEIGARTDRFRHFSARLAAGGTPQAAMVAARVPEHVQAFVSDTLDCALEGQTIEAIAFFLYGREDIIPIMFQRLLDRWQGRHGEIAHFAYYLERHIELDGDEHGPAARRLLARYAGQDDARWYRAARAAERAVLSRTRLWDGVLETIT